MTRKYAAVKRSDGDVDGGRGALGETGAVRQVNRLDLIIADFLERETCQADLLAECADRNGAENDRVLAHGDKLDDIRWQGCCRHSERSR